MAGVWAALRALYAAGSDPGAVAAADGYLRALRGDSPRVYGLCRRAVCEGNVAVPPPAWPAGADPGPAPPGPLGDAELLFLASALRERVVDDVCSGRVAGDHLAALERLLWSFASADVIQGRPGPWRAHACAALATVAVHQPSVASWNNALALSSSDAVAAEMLAQLAAALTALPAVTQKARPHLQDPDFLRTNANTAYALAGRILASDCDSVALRSAVTAVKEWTPFAEPGLTAVGLAPAIENIQVTTEVVEALSEDLTRHGARHPTVIQQLALALLPALDRHFAQANHPQAIDNSLDDDELPIHYDNDDDERICQGILEVALSIIETQADNLMDQHTDTAAREALAGTARILSKGMEHASSRVAWTACSGWCAAATAASMRPVPNSPVAEMIPSVVFKAIALAARPGESLQMVASDTLLALVTWMGPQAYAATLRSLFMDGDKPRSDQAMASLFFAARAAADAPVRKAADTAFGPYIELALADSVCSSPSLRTRKEAILFLAGFASQVARMGPAAMSRAVRLVAGVFESDPETASRSLVNMADESPASLIPCLEQLLDAHTALPWSSAQANNFVNLTRAIALVIAVVPETDSRAVCVARLLGGCEHVIVGLRYPTLESLHAVGVAFKALSDPFISLPILKRLASSLGTIAGTGDGGAASRDSQPLASAIAVVLAAPLSPCSAEDKNRIQPDGALLQECVLSSFELMLQLFIAGPLCREYCLVETMATMLEQVNALGPDGVRAIEAATNRLTNSVAAYYNSQSQQVSLSEAFAQDQDVVSALFAFHLSLLELDPPSIVATLAISGDLFQRTCFLGAAALVGSSGARATLRWWKRVMLVSLRIPEIQAKLFEYLSQQFDVLVSTLCRGLGGTVMRRCTALIAEVLTLLIKWNEATGSAQSLEVILSRAFAQPGVPAADMTEAEKATAVRALALAGARGDRAFRAATCDLARICQREMSVDALLVYSL